MLDTDDSSSSDPSTPDPSTPESTNGSNPTTSPSTGTRRAIPPKRVRVSALAKELGLASKELIAVLAELGEPGKTAASTLDQPLADRVRAARAADGSSAPEAVTGDSTETAGVTETSAIGVTDTTPGSTATDQPARTAPARSRRRSGSRAATTAPATPTFTGDADVTGTDRSATDNSATDSSESSADGAPSAAAPPLVLFVAPGSEPEAPRRRRRAAVAPAGPPAAETDTGTDTGTDETGAADGPVVPTAGEADDQAADPDDVREAAEAEATGAARKRRRRGRRGRGGSNGGQRPANDDDDTDEIDGSPASAPTDELAEEQSVHDADESSTAEDDDETGEGSANSRRRRRRRRTSTGATSDAENSEDDPPNTVVHVRPPREARQAQPKDAGDDGVKGVKGSTRLEARRQRRRDGRDTNRRRPPILTESEFLARREAVDRVMAVRQSGDRTQIAVLEDNVLVEHYVTRASATSYVGNVYLGRVQNVLPSMEAAFIDIAKGRNGVLYAGEVNWDAAGLEGKSRAIEQAMKSGDSVLVQVTKDPIGHKGARLTSQISLPGRFLVYVPGGGMTGISRRLPDTERHRLKAILKKIVPEDAGVIVRTAAEGASEEDLTRDVERLQAEWATIQKKAAKTGSAPLLVHGEPDLATRVVRDVFNEDFQTLTVQGDDAWTTVSEYIEGVAPDLAARAARYTGEGDLFHDLRVDEQLMKALDRKVWLPSGGSLVIDRTEAMTVVDVNTGKFVGSGGNLEQTVTRNNLEAAEEIVRQLRLRDVGGIVVIDFIDMVLESNRELVLRRLTECLGRDRTKHQVAEVTSLGLVQMTRKRVGEGLLEAFSETCEACNGRGVLIHSEPVDQSAGSTDDSDGSAGKSRRRRGAKAPVAEVEPDVDPLVRLEQRTKALAAMSAIHRAASTSGSVDEHLAELELDAVDAVLSGSQLDGEAVAAEVIAADADRTAEPAVAGEIDLATAAVDPDEALRSGDSDVSVDGELAVAAEPAAEPADEQSAESAAEPTAEPAAKPTVEDASESIEPVPTEPAAEAAPEPIAELAAEPDASHDAGTADAQSDGRPARPRRRRAASRPAGPPVTA